MPVNSPLYSGSAGPLIQAFRRYNQIIAEMSGETGSILIDGETMIPGNSEYFNDTVHFSSDTGSQIMARRVSEALLMTPEFKSLAAGKP